MNPTRPSFICASCARALRQKTQPRTVRQFSSTVSSAAPSTHYDPEASEPVPRWKRTPPAMKMPLRLRPQPNQPVWKVNDDDEKLNVAYDRFLGPIAGSQNGRDLLDEETKWLAITHKSHDHGRQGFNDRLAFLGKRIVDLQASLALLAAPTPPQLQNLPRTHVFRHPSLAGLENVTAFAKAQLLDKSRLAMLASRYGLDHVVRWKPVKSNDLRISGAELVMAHTLYSIVGAVALKQGGEMAARTAREMILRPLGVR